MDSRKLTLSTMHSHPSPNSTLAYKSSLADSQRLPNTHEADYLPSYYSMAEGRSLVEDRCM
jgi:hypothetical protein